MSIRFQVKQIPPNKAFIVAQVHGHRIKDSPGIELISAAPLLLVYFEQDIKGVPFQLRAKIRSTPDPVDSGTYLSASIAAYSSMPESIEIEIRVTNGHIYIANTALAIPITWKGTGVYFKSGVYLTQTGSNSNDGGMILINKFFTTP